MKHGLMLQLNEQLVLDFVHVRAQTSRPEIASSLGLSAATVSRIVRRLANQGVISEEPGVSTGGRPASSIAFNPLSGCVVGIDLGGTKCHGMLADLAGDVLVEEVRPSDEDGQPFATLVKSFNRLVARSERAGAPVMALAVGVPAIVDQATGIATGGPNVRWDGFPILSALREHVDVPLVIDNDVNFAALGHAWRGDARGLKDFAVLSLGTGIGAAIVADGRLLKGRGSAAGEIGYLVLDRDLLRAPRPHDLGSFETLASGPRLAELARQAIDESDRSSILRSAESPLGSADVFAAAASGDELAGEVVSVMAEHVAMATIALAAVTDPEIVVLDGSVGRALGGVSAKIEELVARHMPSSPRVVISSLGGEATAIGAVAAALDLSRMHRRPRRVAAMRTADG